MSDLTRALEIACETHQGQKDKAGAEYIRHILAVVRMCAGDTAAEIVAALHDTLEDTKGDRGLLEAKIRSEFGVRIWAAVVAMTHRNGENYDEYIERIAENDLARKVKIKDLTHNMDPRRIPAGQIIDKDFERWDKYRKALVRLERED